MGQKTVVHLHNGILCSRKKERRRNSYAAERKKEFIPFATAWTELEIILLSEISQVVKDKYHMISPTSGTYSTKQTSKQNRTRDMEIGTY